MALIACPECGRNISSMAHFCPKCDQGINCSAQKTPRIVARDTSMESSQDRDLPTQADSTIGEELLQRDFKPSIDEMIVLEGRTFLISGMFTILDCYAYLTSKRYAVCDASGINIIFQVGINGIVFAEESRHRISKKIVVTTSSGEHVQVKCQPHLTWLRALCDPKSFTDSAKKAKGSLANAHNSTVDWFYEVDGIQVGPVKEKLVVQLIQNNHTIYPHTKVRNDSLPEWKRADETILTIFFKELSTSGVDLKSHIPVFHMPGLGSLKKFALLFGKYF